MSDESWALVKGVVRSIANSVPIASSIAAATNEFEAHVQSKRLDEFKEVFGAELNYLEKRLRSVEKHMVESGEVPPILEATTARLRFEPSAAKRVTLAKFMVHSLAIGSKYTPEEKVSFILELDQLTSNDIAVLGKFPSGRAISVPDTLPGNGVFSSNPQDAFGELVSILSKLQSRGLIAETSPGGAIGMRVTSGDVESWQNRWRNKHMVLLPMGAKLNEIMALKP